MKKLLRSPVVTIGLFALAITALLFGSIGGTRAALNATSEIYESQMETSQIGVSLAVDGSSGSTVIAADGSNGVLMKLDSGDMVQQAGDQKLKIGKAYALPLQVVNSGAIPEHVRVVIYRYWVTPKGTVSGTGWFDGSGTKRTDLDPKLITLNPSTGWVLDSSAPSQGGERLVYYTAQQLLPGESLQFLDSVAVNANVLKQMHEAQVNGKTVYVYTYDGAGFVLEVEVDAVQTHNEQQALKGVWGQPIPG